MSEEEKKSKKPAAKKPEAKKAEAKPAAAAKKAAPKAEKPAKAAAPKREKKAAEGVKKQGKLIERISLYDVIERPLITEKATMAAQFNKYVFQVRPDVTKKDVRDAVEALFGVKVTKVNTMVTKGKAKRFRGRPGQRSDVHKAIVTLKAGDTIDLAAGLK